MILCVGPNPALDRTMTAPELRLGHVNRPETLVSQAGGKAANVARVLTAMGHRATLVGPLGGGIGNEIRNLAAAEGLYCQWADSALSTRVCLTVVTHSGVVTDLNEYGRVDSRAWGQFLRLVASASSAATLVLVSGSMPETPSRTPAAELLDAIDSSIPVWIDSADLHLHDLMPSRSSIDLVKINLAEAADVLGRAPTSGPIVETGIELATELSIRLERRVIVTLGADGAVYHDTDRCLWGHLAVDDVVNPTGSGDSFLAGFAAGQTHDGFNPSDALALALSCGASNAQRLGAGQIDVTLLPSLQQRAEVQRY